MHDLDDENQHQEPEHPLRGMRPESQASPQEGAEHAADGKKCGCAPVDFTISGEDEERYQCGRAESRHLDRVGLPDGESPKQHQDRQRIGARVDGDQARPDPDESHQQQGQCPAVARAVRAVR